MYYPEDLVEEIRQRNDIVDVISEHVKLKRSGNNHMGLCPFHNEKSPSFSVSGQKQMYHCFGCGVGGNVFTFVMEYENYSFVEALKYLAERAGIPLPEEEQNEEAKRKADLKTQLLEINRQAAKYFFYQLKSERGKIAYEYLTNRKLTDETIKMFGLGYSNKYSDDLYQYLKQMGYSDEILRQSGLVTFDEKKGAYDKFWNRVMYPIMDGNNRVIGFGGRVLGQGEPKYLNSPETLLFDKSRNLYGLNIAKTARKHNMLICEGYMDVIALHQAGFTNAVASLGTAFTGLQANLLKRYTDEVLLTYDSDGAGVKAALRAIPIMKEAGLRTKVINMRPYKDPDEFMKALGAEEFQKRIDEAQNSFYFEIEVLQKEYDLNDPEQKTKFFNEVAKKLLVFTEEIERNNYIEAIDRIYHMGFDNLRKLVNHYAATMVTTPTMIKKVQERSNNKRVTAQDSMRQASKLLLTWLIEDTRLFSKIKGIISEEDFDGELYQKVAGMLFQQYKEQGQVIPAKIINQFESKEEQNEVASLFSTTFQEEMSIMEKEKALNDLIYRIKKYSLDNRSRNVTDIAQMQSIIKAQADLQKLHISLADG
ncbi:DNA primase [Anaerosporobacter faecicola]|uniref:DNA primase n=1 Tax=Anaerosporobacter faecicola TaxID=2718714 RepID=UPI00143BE424|nr:DNA primase [Anaerosporobacter faecicola]